MSQDKALFIARNLGMGVELLPHNKIRVSDKFGRSAEVAIAYATEEEIRNQILRQAMAKGLSLTA